jgi:hypothetical protein
MILWGANWAIDIEMTGREGGREREWISQICTPISIAIINSNSTTAIYLYSTLYFLHHIPHPMPCISILMEMLLDYSGIRYQISTSNRSLDVNETWSDQITSNPSRKDEKKIPQIPTKTRNTLSATSKHSTMHGHDHMTWHCNILVADRGDRDIT